MDTFCIGPWARARSSKSATAAMILCPAARVSGVISSDTPSCASARRFSGFAIAQFIHFFHRWKNCSRSSAFTGRFFVAADCHLHFQIKIELVEEVRFGLEVGEKRSIRDTSFFGNASVGALRPCVTMTRVAASRIALLFSSLLGLGMDPIYR